MILEDVELFLTRLSDSDRQTLGLSTSPGRCAAPGLFIASENGKLTIYQDDMGRACSVRSFAIEDDACRYFLRLIRPRFYCSTMREKEIAKMIDSLLESQPPNYEPIIESNSEWH